MALSKHCDISKAEAKKVVELFFDEMKKSLAKNDRVEIRGLCTFYVKKYQQYTGRNPKTGEKVTVKAKKLPYFKMGADIRRRLNH
jgi:integration host factor subunit beta